MIKILLTPITLLLDVLILIVICLINFILFEPKVQTYYWSNEEHSDLFIWKITNLLWTKDK